MPPSIDREKRTKTQHADDLHDIRAFVEVAKAGSFLGAAPALGYTSSAISKALNRLEKRLGIRLIQRSTRHLALTDEGFKYLNDCERILDELSAATDAISQRRSAASGRVRIEFPLIWGRREIVPRLPEFAQNYPDIALQMLFNERRPARFDQSIDISIRVGGHAEPGLVSKTLFPTFAAAVASPLYLDEHGSPSSVEDLDSHTCVHYLDPVTFVPIPWMFDTGGKIVSRIFPTNFMIGSPGAMRGAAIAGLGIVQGPDFLFADALENGQLRQILKEKLANGPSVYVSWLQNRYLPKRVRIVIDWIVSLSKETSPKAASR